MYHANARFFNAGGTAQSGLKDQSAVSPSVMAAMENLELIVNEFQSLEMSALVNKQNFSSHSGFGTPFVFFMRHTPYVACNAFVALTEHI